MKGLFFVVVIALFCYYANLIIRKINSWVELAVEKGTDVVISNLYKNWFSI